MNWNKRDTVRTVIILCGVVLFAYVLFNLIRCPVCSAGSSIYSCHLS